MELYIKLILSILSMTALVLLSFAIFQIPIKSIMESNHRQIAILGLVVGSVNFYFKFILNSPYFLLIQLTVWVVTLMMLRRYPLIYAALVTVLGFIGGALIDAVVSLGAIQFQLTDLNEMQNNMTQYVVFHLIVTGFYVLVAVILLRFKIGFSFIVKKFSGEMSLNRVNFLFAGLLIIGILALQLGLGGSKVHSLHSIVIIMLAVILIAAVYFSYLQNKKSKVSRNYDSSGGRLNG